MYNKGKPDGHGIGKGIFSILILLFLFSCAKEDLVIPKDVPARVLNNVSYGADPLQVYDIYLPQNRSVHSTKVLILIHGGGWIQGDKSDMDKYVPIMQEILPDYAIVNLNYRLAQLPVPPAFPNQFLDLLTALNKISEEAVKLGIYPHYGLIGVSAGGHIALQYDNYYDMEDQVKMIGSIAGPTNFTDPFYSENPNFISMLHHLIDESKYPGVQDFAKAVSPAYLVSEKSSPAILFYGQDDELVPVSNGIFLKEQLDAVGVINRLTIYEGGHGDWKETDHDDLIFQLKEFVNIHLPIDD